MAKFEKKYSTDLSDKEWYVLKQFWDKVELKRDPRGRSMELELREVMNAIRYVLRNGVSWRNLPKDYPKAASVYYHFAKWRDEGLWRKMNKHLRRALRKKLGREEEASEASMDSQSIRGSLHEGNGYHGGKKVNGRGRHLLTDTLGLLLVVLVTPANIADVTAARRLCARYVLEATPLKAIWADQAYRRASLTSWLMTSYSWLLTILSKGDVKGFKPIPKRWPVERTFSWLLNYRRLSRDYEVLPESSECWIYMAMSDLMLKRLCGTSTPKFQPKRLPPKRVRLTSKST